MTNYKRTEYGELYTNNQNYELWDNAWIMIGEAVKAKKIQARYDTIEFDRKKRASGSAIHHEIYDIQPDPFKVLLCVRETEGTRYGVKTLQKNYYILQKHGKGVKVTDAPKSKAAKAAKSAGCELGCAIPVCEGKKKLILPRACDNGIAFKKIAVIDGKPVSIYDGSSWEIGVERYEQALRNHNGGLYVYEAREDADKAVFPDDSVHTEKENHAIVKCEVRGNYCRYGRKLAFSHVKPIEILR